SSGPGSPPGGGGMPAMGEGAAGASPEGSRPGGPWFPLAQVFPLGWWVADRGWRRGWTGLFLAAAVAPFVLLHAVDGSQGIQGAAWGFSLYFATGWLLAIRAIARPGRISVWLVGRVALFTVVVGVALSVAIESAFGGEVGGLVHNTLAIGLPEEAAKALPVFLFVYLARHRYSTRAFLFLGAVSGLAFGVTEAVVYSAAYANLEAVTGSTTYITQEVWRLVTDPLIHACLAGIAAYFMGLSRVLGRRRVRPMAAGLGLAAVLHGVYDTYANLWLGVVVAAVVVVIFLGYVRGGDAIEARLEGPRVPR
ncbi:MAG TPA: PrsW family glutamic-type intramembrane protease, partial [Acidimicrobiales bacterium]|nr:PrsW family glutamic-type intramembrane protease [Acidimicrobiales bacterium]